MDAFYASVELRRRPELKGKPVVVCGSGPRAVVTTASYEARKLAGIHSAMPAAVARRRLPDAVYLRPDFTAYREASGEVMAILRRNAETVEVVGLDEAYVDLTGLFSPKATMRRIAAEIREETGLTCSIGISENRMLAKITSELGKPAGLVVLSRAEALERFAGDSPGLVPGIGPKTVTKLERMGIRTLADAARRRTPTTLEAAFGPRHGRLAAAPRPRFEDETPLTVVRETKSQSAETTFDVDVADRGRAGAPRWPRSPRSSAGGCASRELEGRTIGIKVRLDDWTNVTRSHTVERADQRPGRGRPGRARPAARLRPAAPGAAARRPGRRLRARGGRRGGATPRRPSCSSASRLSAAAELAARPASDADAGEAEPLLGRLGQVEVAAGDVGAAVDDRHGDRAAVVAELHLGPAGQRLVGDAERARLQGAAAGDAVAVEARAVVGGAGLAVGGEAARDARRAPRRAGRGSP